MINKNNKIIEIINKKPIINKISKQLEKQNFISIKHLEGSYKQLITLAYASKCNQKIFVLVNDNNVAEDWFDNLSIFIDQDNIVRFFHQSKSLKIVNEDNDFNINSVIEEIEKFNHENSVFAIATPDFLNIHLPNKNLIEESKIKLEKNQQINFDSFIQDLLIKGFDKKDFVEKTGDISIRGGIVDLFPIDFKNPVRIEFWDNDIESIREFDIISQRSISELNSIEFIAEIFNDSGNNSTNLTDYLPNNIITIIDTPETILANNENINFENFKKVIYINNYNLSDINLKSFPQLDLQSSIKNLVLKLKEYYQLNYDIILTSEGAIHSNRLKELIENYVFNSNELFNSSSESEKFINYINWLDHTFSSGFVDDENQIVVFTEHQIFNRNRIRLRQNRNHNLDFSIDDLKELNIGDYVVHSDKGIAKFSGFEKVKIGGNVQECLKLKFEGDDYLYVNLNYLNKIHKYSAQEGVIPKLTKLGSYDWERKKSKTKKRLKNIARDLIKLYAQRKMSNGFSYPADSIWQKEFEASFFYEDTPDQAQATLDIKKDMEDISPMDRLVCGDVGFGKTEVAIRAAFKAVQSGKQVTVLVPTTILAQQHYMTFKDRLSKYPVNIEVLSRFKTKSQQTSILEKLSTGQIDIIIGTHRLLSNDVKFKDLGLLIIDEEHRFGVSAKEKLKQIKINVDTLTLTATPIPRTLNFSLMGARDLSIIETPPRNRLPVYTEVIEWNDEKIVNAIEYEIQRNGQVFFVNDKVNNIELIYDKLKRLLPNFKFAIAHGQMKSSKLENIMAEFISGKFDVLVATKIIESGLDIPNANTIIINEAQNYGLAELYQLRGRVGRTNKQAYCYLIVPSFKTLSSNALKRLYAIEEFTDLGSGFRLALKDMEIRGAGDLLGPEQSGYINDIGFELYHKILDEVVQELRREEYSDIFSDDVIIPKMFENNDIEIQIDSEALIPDTYIKNEIDRFSYYKKLYNTTNIKELKDIELELNDKYGKFPAQVNELFFAVKLRIASLNTGFTKLILKPDKLILELPPESNSDYYEKAFPNISEVLNDIRNSRFIQQKKRLILEIPISSRDNAIENLWKIKYAIENLF